MHTLCCGLCPYFTDKKEEILSPFNGIYGKIYRTIGICSYSNKIVNELHYCDIDWDFENWLKQKLKELEEE